MTVKEVKLVAVVSDWFTTKEKLRSKYDVATGTYIILSQPDNISGGNNLYVYKIIEKEDCDI